MNAEASVTGELSVRVGRALLGAGALAALLLVAVVARDAGTVAFSPGTAGEWIEYAHVPRTTSHPARPLEAVFRGPLGSPATGDEAVALRCLGTCRALPLAAGDRAAAETAFSLVKKPDYALLTRLWLIYTVQQP